MKSTNRSLSSILLMMLASVACMFGLIALAGCTAEEAADVVAQELVGGEESSGSDAGNDDGEDGEDSEDESDDD